MFDTAEEYSGGKSEEELSVYLRVFIAFTYLVPRGRVIKELGLRRTDVSLLHMNFDALNECFTRKLVISTKIFWGTGRKGPNDGGLSRKQ